MDEVTVYECVACECRGPKADEVRHLVICSDRSVVRAITFRLGHDTRPLF